MENAPNPERDVDLKTQILVLLENTEDDYVTLDRLANECGVDQQVMQETLDELEPVVRKAISYMAAGDKWYRLTSKGLTAGEQRLRANALVTFIKLRNNNV